MNARRIITFMALPRVPLQGHTDIPGRYSDGVMQRFFTTATVHYDNCTPMYSMPDTNEVWYGSLREIKNNTPKYLWDHPILESDNYLKVWDEK